MKDIVGVYCRGTSRNCSSTLQSTFFVANVVLAGGRGERRLRADDDELAAAKDPEHGQLLLGAATGPAARKPAVFRRPLRSGPPSPRRSFPSEVGGQPARLDVISRPRYVLRFSFFCDNVASIFRATSRARLGNLSLSLSSNPTLLTFAE